MVLELAAGMDIPAREEGMVVQDLVSADEIFLTGTGAELIPVVDLDGQQVADGRPGPVFLRLLEAFRATTRTQGEPFLDAVGEIQDS